MRIILFTGKGGVGKTTMAAATALRASQLGHRTVVLSTDAAHSLADSFDLPLGPEPTPIAANLWGQETDIYYNLEKYWGKVQEWVRALLSWRGLDELVADEVASLPGMDELSNLLWINDHHASGRYDAIIVDCAPTGETLKLLSFPDIAGWWVEKLLPVHRRVVKVIRPMVRPFSDIPLPTDEVYVAGEELFRRLEELRALLANVDETSVRLVLNPEKMVIKEAQRTFTYLNLYGYPTDAVICNRLIPAEVEDPYFQSWKTAQEQYFHLIQECFSPLPLFTAPLMEQEVVGLEMLEQVAAALYGQKDPTQLFFRGPVQEVTREDGRYVLTIALPFVSKEQISLMRAGEELVVSAGSFKRSIILPRMLHGLSTLGAKFEGTKLRIAFGEASREEESP
ncbi:MAG: TRC40/GET3/ArsA family transport-energizing ATPase [Dehalococcoidia bacterium]|nr:TRC40/GET3/ArsA family transport-energizing ATPase [Dehalococcoidia bacterium]